jgi:hypothetical protein
MEADAPGDDNTSRGTLADQDTLEDVEDPLEGAHDAEFFLVVLRIQEGKNMVLRNIQASHLYLF